MPARNGAVRRADGAAIIDEFLGSAHIFAAAVRDVIETTTLEKVAGPRLTPSQLKLLKLVAMTGESLTLGDVAAFLGVSNAAASKAVDKLVRRGWLRRTEGQKDRRAMNLWLTAPSRKLLAAYETAMHRKLAGIFRGVSAAGLRRTAQLLDRLSANIVDEAADPEELCLKCGIYFRERCLLRQMMHRNCFYVRNKQRRLVPPSRPRQPHRLLVRTPSRK